MSLISYNRPIFSHHRALLGSARKLLEDKHALLWVVLARMTYVNLLPALIPIHAHTTSIFQAT